MEAIMFLSQKNLVFHAESEEIWDVENNNVELVSVDQTGCCMRSHNVDQKQSKLIHASVAIISMNTFLLLLVSWVYKVLEKSDSLLFEDSCFYLCMHLQAC